MNRNRKLVLIILAVIALALILAPAALAAAGGGSAGFGGGGGGGDGGGGGGRGAGLYILIQILIRIAILGHGLGALILIGLVVLYLIFTRVTPGARNFWSAHERSGRRSRRRVAQRQRRVELAAAEAADDDPAFAPDFVRTRAAKLFTQIQSAWDAADRNRLKRLIGPDLLEEWGRRLDDFDRRGWRNHVQPVGDPKVEYVALTNKGNRAEDRVTVRIEATLRDYVVDQAGNRLKRRGRMAETVKVREFWTLAKDDHGQWILQSIEQGAEGEHALESDLVATPWSDDEGMRDEALVEQAVADAVPEGTKIAELADLEFDGDARAAALDLSLADGRFSPTVLEVAARRAVAAWADAVDGDDSRLRAIAHPAATRDLLHPGDPSERTRVVVRGPKVRQIRVAALDAAAEPPTMAIDVEIEGRRYIEDRDTTEIVAGSQSRATKFTEHWKLALDGDAAQPWRITAAGAAVGPR